MANIFTKITRIIKNVVPQQERRCPACKRALQQAIDEQLRCKLQKNNGNITKHRI
jgi:PP-loop superfamily ATP-utilizing enzyme